MITSGMRNAAIDFEAAKAHNVVLCGTNFARDPTAPLAMGLILELTRNIGRESARMHAGEPWQAHLGIEIEGRTLGVIGLGKLGTKVAKLAQAFGMNVIAWSPNLTPEKCKEAGVTYASKEELFRNADVITIHVVLGPALARPRRARRPAAHEATSLSSSTPRAGRSSTRWRCWRCCSRRRSRAPASTCSRSSRCRSIIPSASSTTW